MPIPAPDRTRPLRFDYDELQHALIIEWADGTVHRIPFTALRRACPCAMCKGETNVMVEYKPPPQSLTPSSFELRGWQYVGGYAIQPQWGDGHASGIYSFQYLRELETAR